MPPLGDRVDDRRTVRPIEVHARLGEVGRSDRVDAGAVCAVTVNAVALGIVVEQRLATAGFDAVGFLTAELQDIFGDIVDLRRVKEFVGASRVCSGLKSGNQAATWATSASPPRKRTSARLQPDNSGWRRPFWQPAARVGFDAWSDASGSD